MKLTYEPPVAKVVETIQVRDSNGKIWEIERSDVVPRRTIYEDYQGAAIFSRALSTTTPEGEWNTEPAYWQDLETHELDAEDGEEPDVRVPKPEEAK